MVSVDGSIENKRSRGWFQLMEASRIRGAEDGFS
jgi:hypothetical protein